MLINLEERIKEIRTKTLERSRVETSDNQTILAGEGTWSDNEIKQMMRREWHRLYGQVVEQVPHLVLQETRIESDDISQDEAGGAYFYEINDLWKLMDLYVFYSTSRQYPYRLRPVEYEDMFDYYNQALSIVETDDVVGYYLRQKKLYLPFKDSSYLIQYLKEQIPIEEADMPSLFWDYIVVATAAQMKISGQEATMDSPLLREKMEFYEEIKQYILTNRNKGNPRRIRRRRAVRINRGVIRP